MKIIATVIFLCCCYQLSFCQNKGSKEIKPAKGNSFIFVESPLGVREVAATLIANNYLLDKIDTAFNTITTQPKGIPGINGEYYIAVVKSDSLYKISAMMRLNFIATLAGIIHEKGPYEVSPYTKSRGAYRRAFDGAVEASKIIGVIVKYQ